MDPKVRRDLALAGQLYHVNGRRVAALPTGSAFQRRLELPDRCIPRPADRTERRMNRRLHAALSQLTAGTERACEIPSLGVLA